MSNPCKYCGYARPEPCGVCVMCINEGKMPDSSSSKRHRKIRSGDKIDPISILERDGWKCKSCGIDTPRELRGTCEANAPEVDHVYPLALGGKHVRANLQCLCRKCNGRKGIKLVV